MRYPHHQHPQGLITTTLGLEMDIEVHHFQDGEMRVKCVASVSPVLWQGDKENVIRRRMLEHQETMLLGKSNWSDKSSFVRNSRTVNNTLNRLPIVCSAKWSKCNLLNQLAYHPVAAASPSLANDYPLALMRDRYVSEQNPAPRQPPREPTEQINKYQAIKDATATSSAPMKVCKEMDQVGDEYKVYLDVIVSI